MEKICRNSNRLLINRQLSNLPLRYRGNSGNLSVIWLVYHDDLAEELSNPSPRPQKHMHKHMFCETHACLRGTTDYAMEDGTRFHLQPGDVLFIPPDCTHMGVERSPDLSKVAFAFAITDEEGGERTELRAAMPREPACFRGTDEVYDLFEQIMSEVVGHAPFYVECIETLVFRIVALYARLLAPRREWTDFANPEKQVVDGRVRELTQYVEAHLSESIAVSDVAESLHLSAKQINRLLQKEFLMNCSEYIERKKVEKAKELLAFTDMRVEDVAAAVGYANTFSFSKFFKRAEGMAPSLFRSSRFNKT